MGEQLVDSAEIKEKMEETLRLLDEMVADASGFQTAVGQFSETMRQVRSQMDVMDARLAGLPLVLDDAKPRIMRLYVDLTDPETGDVVDTRMGLFSNDWILAEASDEGPGLGELSRESVETMAWNLAHSLGVEQVVKRVTLKDDFPQGSFEWDIALDALHDQEGKQAAPKMGM